MKELENSYGKKTFDEWHCRRPRDLTDTKTCHKCANESPWLVSTFSELLDGIAFLGAMNKRLALFYRGQCLDLDPLPAIFRNTWKAFDTGKEFNITPASRQHYMAELKTIGEKVYTICDTTQLGLPRWRGLMNTHEIQWAVVQHYGLWPTPLLDVTSNLRVAASFAMNYSKGAKETPKKGYLYVAGMPHPTDSIHYVKNQEIVIARLQSACPPVAKRPHYQDGFLVGTNGSMLDEPSKSSLYCRLIAKFELHDNGSFWDNDFPPISEGALLPSKDELKDKFVKEFGASAPNSLSQRLEKLPS